MNLDRLKRLEEKFLPKKIPEMHVIIWYKYLGETKDEAIKKYMKDKNVKKFEMKPIVICVPTGQEIRERHAKNI